ncbi:MAG TPA: hypothetical protein P5511_05680 [Candidatus Goldiibacteriota bacterium]|nr:hypothetical protein [Candidatus Goldiibacteriota bacterium]
MVKRILAVFLIICMVSVPALMAAPAREVIIDEAVLEPKDPILSTVVALGPGLLVHGFGHYFTENYKMGLFLTGMEVISVGAMILGYIQNTTPDMFTIYGGNTDEARRAGAVTFGVGFTIFMASWLADVFLAGKSAEQYNKEHNLEFRMYQESMLGGTEYALLYNYNF